MISFIIPAYNAEKTIERAIISIADMIKDAEIIVVENGSEDSTVDCVKALQKKFENVRLLYSDKGVSKARNAALDTASGEWIAFVDADDYLDGACNEIFSKCIIDETVDLWLFGHYAGERAKTVTDGTSIRTFGKEKIDSARVEMLNNPTKYMQVWAKLFKTSVIKKYDLRFNEKMQFSEDSDFTLRYSKYCSKVCFSPEVTYHYSLNANSVMRVFDGKKVQKYLYALAETEKNVCGECDEIIKAFQKYVLMHLNIAMVREVFHPSVQRKMKMRIGDMRKIVNEPIFQNAVSSTAYRECYQVRMLPVLFLKMNWMLPAALIYTIRAWQNTIEEKK